MGSGSLHRRFDRGGGFLPHRVVPAVHVNRVVPVMPLRRVARTPASPTSLISSSAIGEFFTQYCTIASMIPIALAARDAKGPAEIVLQG